MKRVELLISLSVVLEYVIGNKYHNATLPDASTCRLVVFRQGHRIPVRVMTRVTGELLNIRDTITLNTKTFDNRNHFRLTSHLHRERIPERIVHSKGVGAFGYFEVTHDTSKYTKADIFNGIGKRKPVAARFSANREKLGGNDVGRDVRAVALKMCTNHGNLDSKTFHIPLFFYKDSPNFMMNGHTFRRNPRTSLFDAMVRWDFISLRLEILHSNLWVMSNIVISDGYRKTDYYPLHIYEIYNKHGKRFFVKFNFISEIGVHNLTNTQARVLRVEDTDYFNRDLYNSIDAKKYPAWKLNMDILTKDNLTKLDFDYEKKEHSIQ